MEEDIVIDQKHQEREESVTDKESEPNDKHDEKDKHIPY